jgi:hypothetical protein
LPLRIGIFWETRSSPLSAEHEENDDDDEDDDEQATADVDTCRDGSKRGHALYYPEDRQANHRRLVGEQIVG